MLEKATDTLIAAVELFEAEGRLLRRVGAELVLWGVIVIGCSIVAVLGVVAVLVGIAWLLADQLGVAAALAVTGGAAIVCGGGLAAIGRRKMQRAGEEAS